MVVDLCYFGYFFVEVGKYFVFFIFILILFDCSLFFYLFILFMFIIGVRVLFVDNRYSCIVIMWIIIFLFC